jgi:hypothetical protein
LAAGRRAVIDQFGGLDICTGRIAVSKHAQG